MINRECQLVSSVIISNKIIFEQENKIPECDESMVMYLIKRLIFTKVYKLRKTWIFSSKGICSFKVRSLLNYLTHTKMTNFMKEMNFNKVMNLTKVIDFIKTLSLL